MMTAPRYNITTSKRLVPLCVDDVGTGISFVMPRYLWFFYLFMREPWRGSSRYELGRFGVDLDMSVWSYAELRTINEERIEI